MRHSTQAQPACYSIILTIEELAAAVKQVTGRVELEASGNFNLDNLRATALTGVDYISVGGLTKNIRAIDLSMRFESL